MERMNSDDEGNNYLHEMLGNGDCIDIRELQTKLKTFLSHKSKKSITCLLNNRNIYGNTPLMEYISCMEPSNEIVSQVINCGCDVNIPDNLQMTPLHKITGLQFVPGRLLDGKYLGEMEKTIVDQQFKSEKQIMMSLIQAGAEVNKSDIFGRTPLFLANDIHVIRTLLKNGADINVTDKCGRSVLLSVLSMPNNDFLFEFYTSIMELDQVQRPDIFGSTSLDYAAILCRSDLVEKITKILAKSGDDNPSTLDALHIFTNQTVLYDRRESCQQIRLDLKKVRCVHYTDVIKCEDVSYAVHQPKNTDDICRILNHPGLGVPRNKEESDKIKFTINDFAKNLCHYISVLDPRLKCVLFPTGSSAEGTKIGDPTEFDFVFCLTEFSKQCDIVELQTKKGFAELRNFVNIIPEQYKMFFDNNRKCKATEIRCVFSKVLKSIVLDKNTWSNPHLFFDGDVKHLQEYDRPVFTLKLQWVGRRYKDEEISLDIVPAVRKTGWWPSDTSTSVFDMLPEKVRREGCLLLLQNPYEDSDTLFRISSSPAEICLLKSLPDYIRQSYRLCKLLRHKSLCPVMDPDPTSDIFPDFEADDCITSYMLKNCVFYIYVECLREKNLEKGEKSEENTAIVNKATRILKKFDQCAALKTLPVYFIPNREDIFRFNFKEMDNLDEQSVEKYNHFHCSRRRAFVKIMLYVLGQLHVVERD